MRKILRTRLCWGRCTRTNSGGNDGDCGANINIKVPLLWNLPSVRCHAHGAGIDEGVKREPVGRAESVPLRTVHPGARFCKAQILLQNLIFDFKICPNYQNVTFIVTDLIQPRRIYARKSYLRITKSCPWGEIL